MGDTVPEPVDVEGSESGRTYTISDKSVDLRHPSRSLEESLGVCSVHGVAEYSMKLVAEENLGPRSLGQEFLLDKSRDGRRAASSTPVYNKAVMKNKSGSLPLHFSDKQYESAFEFKNKRLSLDLQRKSKGKEMKTRSISFDYKKLSSRSSSEIASNYLPESLKNAIDLKDSEDDDIAKLPLSIENYEGLSSTTSTTVSTTSQHISKPYCELSAQHNDIASAHGASSCMKNSISTSPSVTKSVATSGFRFHNGTSETCPVHTQNNGGSSKTSVSLSSCNANNASSNNKNQLLHCSICDNKFTKPKVLPCLHTFCEHCLVSYTPPESLTLTCPLCRQQSILPKDGVTALQANRWLNGMMQALEIAPDPRLCSHCDAKSNMTCTQCNPEQDSGSECQSVISLDDSSSHVTCSDSFHDETTLYCPSHSGQTLRFYCRNCETAVCSSCTDIEHQNHTTMRLNEAIDHQKVDLERILQKVTTIQMPCMKEALCDLSDAINQLEDNKKEAESDIRSCFHDLHNLLDQRQTDLINILNTNVTCKRDTIETQRDELECWVSGVQECCEYVEKTLPNLPPMEVVLVKNQIDEKLHSYVSVDFPPIPRENAFIQFALGNIDPLKNAFKHVGRIQTNSAVPQQTTVIGDPLKKTFVGRQNVVTVITRDHKGSCIKTGGAEVKATVIKVTTMRNGHHQHHASNEETKSSPGSTRCNSRMESSEIQVLDLNNGSYDVYFSVQSIGTYTLSLFLHGQHISASPFTLEARMPHVEEGSDATAHRRGQKSSLNRQISRSTQGSRKVSGSSSVVQVSHKSSCSRKTLKEPLEDDLVFKVGRRGRNRGEFVNPQGVCYSPIKEGRIVVADSNNQCVQVFNLEGDCKVKFGTRGRGVGQLQRPTGVASLSNGHYAVADYENRWISIFEPSGKYVSRIGNGKLLGPKGICVTGEGHMIVVDNKASCILVFHPSGKLLNKFGNRMVEGYNFAGPHFCAANSKGDIIVTDFHNHCVRVFDSSGIARFTFGTNGEGNGQFNAPTGLAVDDNDNIIVADWGNSRIQVFDCQGSFLSFVNTLTDPLYGPQGLALTADGNIVVADSGNHCLKVYKYLQ